MRGSRFLAVVLTAGATWAAGATAQEPSRYQGPIIDMHMHASPLNSSLIPSGCLPRGGPCTQFQPKPDAKPVLEETLAEMDKHNIVLAFLSWDLADVYRWVDAAPGRFIASPTVFDVNQVDLAELRRDFQAGRLRGMGEIGVMYAGIPADDPRVAPYFALAEEFDVPVLVHLQGIGAVNPAFRIMAGHPERIEQVLRTRPRLRPFLENAGFPFLEETISLMYTFPNVHADISTITWVIPREMFYRYLRALVEAGLGKRLMFGSDHVRRPQVIGPAIEAIQGALFLTSEQKADIFYNNAARFLRLSDETIAKHHRR